MSLSNEIKILAYVKRKNELGIPVLAKNIASDFDMRECNVSKYIKLMREKGYITRERRGKTKLLEITNEGDLTLQQDLEPVLTFYANNIDSTYLESISSDIKRILLNNLPNLYIKSLALNKVVEEISSYILSM